MIRLLIIIARNKTLLSCFGVFNSFFSTMLSFIIASIRSTSLGGKFKIFGCLNTPNRIYGLSGFQVIKYRYKFFPLYGLTYIRPYKHPLLSKYCIKIKLGFNLTSSHVNCSTNRVYKVGFTVYVSFLSRFNQTTPLIQPHQLV